MKVKLTIDEVFRRTLGLKIDHPKKFRNLVNEFISMSSGSEGGIYFLSSKQTTVRKQYYWNWTDEDFKELLEMLKG